MALPTGYTEVQYIQSTGTQYVDTEFKPTGKTKAICDFVAYNQATDQQGIFGSRPGASNRFTLFTGQSIGSLQADYNTGESLASASTAIAGLDLAQRVTVSMSNVLAINEKTVNTVSLVDFTASYNLYLFANNNAGTAQLPASLKLYSCQIYDNATLIRDYTPCINPDGEAGLYDTVNSKFYGNAGTGVFFAGPPRVSLPSGYKQLEYILSDNTQYINTGVIPNQDSRIVYDCERSAGLTQERFFGVRTGSTATDAFYFYIYQSKWRYIYNNATIVGDTAVDGRFLIDANKNIAIINGTMTFTGTYGQFTCAMPALLFAARAAPSDMLRGTHKLFSCKMYQNGALARNYIPCSNPSGELGLYDLVTRSFYANGGTNPFTAGPEVTWPSNDAIYVKVNGIWRQIDGIKLL